MEINKITESVIGSAIEVHKVLGPGLLESAYEECLCHELSSHGVMFRRQVRVPVSYKNVDLDVGYQLDLIIEGKVIVELKSVERLKTIHDAQLLTYMKLVGCTTGLLINFNVAYLKQGIKRKVLNFVE